MRESALEGSTVRILVVDDYDPWRRFVSTTISKHPKLHVIGEASDGLEAVLRAEELQPDLIVLDIGLPTLNGLEVARRIRKLSPESKILFISQESSADLVREALDLGAFGYLVKVHAGSELLAAVEAVAEGRQYLSGVLADHQHATPAGTQAAQFLAHAGFPIATTEKREVASSHESNSTLMMRLL
jgi:DNA-binding NarL/FixJ family response regulator